MHWEHEATLACAEKGLSVVGFDGGWVFVKDENSEPFAVSEEVVAVWIKNYKEVK